MLILRGSHADVAKSVRQRRVGCVSTTALTLWGQQSLSLSRVAFLAKPRSETPASPLASTEVNAPLAHNADLSFRFNSLKLSRVSRSSFTNNVFQTHRSFLIDMTSRRGAFSEAGVWDHVLAEVSKTLLYQLFNKQLALFITTSPLESISSNAVRSAGMIYSRALSGFLAWLTPRRGVGSAVMTLTLLITISASLFITLLI